MKWTIVLLLIALPCLAGDTKKPPCNAKNRGLLWRAPAGAGSDFGKPAARCGEVELCTLGTWKYRWQALTVHISRLGKHGNAEVADCGRLASERQAGEDVDRR